MIKVSEVKGKNLDDFIKFSFLLYAKDPFFSPTLIREMRTHFSEKNPFFLHARARYLLARNNGRTVGRIVSFVNRRHNDFHHEKTGFFGFFECINDSSVATALFDSAAVHLRREGMVVMRGPMNFSTNEECGFLFEGFHAPPMLMTPYNPPYYNEFSELYGLKKAKDLYGYIHTVQDVLPEKILRVAAIADKRGITVRPAGMTKFPDEMLLFRDIYNSAWEGNWGFIPLTEEELSYMGHRLKQIAIPELTLIAMDHGEPIGFMGLLPDFNMVLRHMQGKISPLTLLKALYYSRKISDLRLLLLGIKKEYRNKGVDALLFREGFKAVRNKGFKRVEFSWVLEDNIPVQRLIDMIGGRLYKKYRVYEMLLQPL